MQTDELKQKAKKAVYWNTGFNFFRDTLQFGVMLVLVRIIPPEAYGQFGLVNSIIGFIGLFSFTTFISHSLQIRNFENIDYQTQFTTGLFIQIVVIVITLITAFVLSLTETYHQISLLVALMSIIFVLDLPSQLQIKQFEKQLDWKRLRILHAIGLVASSVTAIILGLLGTEVYALLLPGLLVTIPFIYELFIINKWRPNWKINKKNFRDTFRFSVAQSGVGLTTKLQPLIESTYLTSVIGFYNFGILGRAFGLARIISDKFVTQLLYATYPVLTNIEVDSPQYRKAINTLFIIIISIVLPLVFIFSLHSESIVLVLYGIKWIEVIPLLPPVLAIVCLTSLNNTFNNILLSYYKQNLLLYVAIISLLINVMLLFLLVKIDLLYYLYGLIVLQSLILVSNIIFSLRYKLISLKVIIQNTLGVLIVSFIAYLPFLIINNYWDNYSRIENVLEIIIYMILYFISLRIFMKDTFLTLINYLPFKKNILALFRVK